MRGPERFSEIVILAFGKMQIDERPWPAACCLGIKAERKLMIRTLGCPEREARAL